MGLTQIDQKRDITIMEDRIKTIFITGANRGIGLGFVKEYLNRGNKVIATTRNIDNSPELLELMQKYSDQLNIEQLDVDNAQNFIQLKQKYKNTVIDVLINNAGIFPEEHSRSGLSQSNPQDILHAFQTNAVGALVSIQSFEDNLLKSSNPIIINMSSQMASFSYAQGFCYSYRMSKVALNMLTKCYAQEQPKIITVALRAGWVKTKMGGVNATLTVEESVNKMIKVIDNLKITDSGHFLDNEKNLCEW